MRKSTPRTAPGNTDSERWRWKKQGVSNYGTYRQKRWSLGSDWCLYSDRDQLASMILQSLSDATLHRLKTFSFPYFFGFLSFCTEWAEQLTEMGKGKHFIGDFLPPEELEKFMETFKALKVRYLSL